MHPYSADKSFLDVTGVKKLWGNPETIALEIQENIKKWLSRPKLKKSLKNKEEHILVMTNMCSSFVQLKRPILLSNLT